MIRCIGIAGGTGSGKTALSAALAEALGARAAVVAQDWYYRDQSHIGIEQRLQVNYDHPDAIEMERLARDLALLKAGHVVDAPQYDFTTHTRAAVTRRVGPRPVLILEGLHVLYDADLRALIDVKVFLDVAADLRLARRLRRDTGERGRTAASVMGSLRTSSMVSGMSTGSRMS
ncbi:MAG TPA: uridine kinase [Candidatus Hydrogenedentes bacterium]|nr:uridine kinase [Candidatus Hydrogenedentota bacterium]